MTTEHFTFTDGVAPQNWLQQRLVDSGEALSVVRNYPPTGGGNKNDLLQSVVVSWTNDTPIVQHVMGMVTRGGSTVSLQARSRGFLSAAHAYEITDTPLPLPAPSAYSMLEVSRSGIGMDVGLGGLLALGTGFAIAEKRQPSTTIPFMPHAPGMIRVEPGQTLHARVDVRFISEFWENTAIDGGAASTSSYIISGDTRIDLWAFPAIVDAGPRLVPWIVGTASGRALSADVHVTVPAGLEAGDIILAFMFNHWGWMGELIPGDAGWTQLNAVDAGWGNVHSRLLWRVATGTETTFTFRNGWLSECHVILVVVRDASYYLEEWYAASEMRTNVWWERDKGHKTPSIDRNGGLLLAFSGVAHTPLQGLIYHSPPEGMTELLDLAWTNSSVTLAALSNPPRPTGVRKFGTSEKPIWTGHSITLALLIPGAWPELGGS